MEVKILFFGITTDLTGTSAVSLNIEEETTVKQLKNKLISTFNNLKNIHQFAIAVNETYAEDDLVLKNNDTIAVLPPVSGG